ncbi:acetoacetyl-CoA reductase [uncultured Hyphomonas sp.]|jgi:acetoacetyl-CoA reductase|uniref:acetoacetyl-CoA reductase n=1 Tax=uncultured Hyphomonas sp. TaxID=225298 RepID=UPI000C3CC33D|nr:beta-ketoacyl-ACP reductase [Hyphomonadaceae bacterium]MBL4879305.1 acetoacetyl-CoA reductase [Hyphomonas sp.]|tara:strand:- start:79479 stop:80198 length:720 start_codon:yes stop_codon:yes gene_type:complete
MARIALITGGTTGLGAATADALEADGCKVIVTARSPDKAKAYKLPAGRACYGWDVSDFSACSDSIAAIEDEIGPIDILVNNAGVTADSMLHKMSPEQWQSVLRVDLDSMFNTTRQVISGMRERGFGRIINISSVNALKGQFGQTNYSAAKAGVIGFTKALALESARKGITVNAIAPGYADTAMVAAVPDDVMKTVLEGVPLGRLAEPSEIARCVAFLASDQSGFITGSTLHVNGGLYLA